MVILLIIILALVVSWLDIAFAVWCPVWLLPVWIWIGIHFFVLKNNIALMWFWITSCVVVGLFMASIIDSLFLFIIFGLGGQLFSLIYRKYLSINNFFIILLPSLIILALCQILLMLATNQIISWALIGRICVTIIILGVITYFYDPHKEKKKYI